MFMCTWYLSVCECVVKVMYLLCLGVKVMFWLGAGLVQWLERSPVTQETRVRIPSEPKSFSKRTSVHPAVNGYLALFRTGEGKDSEGEEIGTALIMLAS